VKNERDVKEAVKKCLKSFAPRVWYFMPVMNGFGQQGVPDFVVCVNGMFLSIETKFGNNKEREWQKIQAGRICDAGGSSLLITEKNVTGLEAGIRAMLEDRDA
jgi:hypothetical protein